MEVLHNFQKFRVLWHRHTELAEVAGGYKTCCTRTPGIVARTLQNSQSSGYGYESLTELPDVPGTGMKILQNFQNFRVLWHGRIELPEVPGRYKHAVPIPRVFVVPAYRTSMSSGYAYGCPTEPTEVLCRVIPGVNTPGMVFCVPYRQNEDRKFGYGYECRT